VKRCPGTRMLALGLALLVDSFCVPARAYPDGIAADGCGGCHNGGSASGSLALSVSPAAFDPGDEVTVEVRLEASSVVVGGVYVTTDRVGTFRALGGEGLAPTSSGIVHDEPRDASGGEVAFRFAWRAPSEPGGVRFRVYALAANGNGNRSGDTAFSDDFERVFGCEAQTFYYDGDGDQFGRDGSTALGCQGAPPTGYTIDAGDCVDYDETIHPGALEVCDQEDNDCNLEVDENAEPVALWPDADGDGYYGRDERVGEPMLGCVGLEGYAAAEGDCAPNEPSIHPDAEEICNFIDEDCDSDVDERVRPTCGEGWCRRESSSCSVEQCIEGLPLTETCNLLDDDCDGELDEGPLCPEGSYCVEGVCTGKGEVPGEDDGDGPAGDGGGEGSAETDDAGGCGVGRGGPGWLGLVSVLAVLLRRRRAP
jgi:hypothetical protein